MSPPWTIGNYIAKFLHPPNFNPPPLLKLWFLWDLHQRGCKTVYDSSYQRGCRIYKDLVILSLESLYWHRGEALIYINQMCPTTHFYSKGNLRRSIGYCPHLWKPTLQPFQPAQQSQWLWDSLYLCPKEKHFLSPTEIKVGQGTNKKIFLKNKNMGRRS